MILSIMHESVVTKKIKIPILVNILTPICIFAVQKNNIMFEFLTNRRTIRKYTDKSIDQNLITQLLEAAAQSSNTGNMQAYSVVVTTDSELKKQLLTTKIF